MSYGFEAFNQNNIQQIDGSYSNYYLIDSGTSSTSSSGGIDNWVNYYNNNAKKVTINFTNTSGQFPLIFIKCNSASYSNNREFIFFSVELTSTTSFNILAFKAYDSTSYPYSYGYVTQSFSWRVYLPEFVLNPFSVSTGYGLNVFREDGKPVFSSNLTNVMKIYNNYDVYGAWNVIGNAYSVGNPANYGLFQEPIDVGSSTGDIWFLANQSVATQISATNEETGTTTYGVWIGARSINGIDYLSGWIEPIARSASQILELSIFYAYGMYVSNYNSSTGQLTIQTFERISTGPLTNSCYPTGTEFYIFKNDSIGHVSWWGPFTSTNTINGSNDSIMYFTIPTGLSIPTGYAVKILQTNKMATNNASVGNALMRVPGVLVLKS